MQSHCCSCKDLRSLLSCDAVFQYSACHSPCPPSCISTLWAPCLEQLPRVRGLALQELILDCPSIHSPASVFLEILGFNNLHLESLTTHPPSLPTVTPRAMISQSSTTEASPLIILLSEYHFLSFQPHPALYPL